MEIVRTIPGLQELLKKASGPVGFVPTMGALHQGHISLAERARQENNIVVVSIFVNPTQFNDPKDLESYPRTEAADFKMLEKAGLDIVFVPSVQEIYPGHDNRRFDFGNLEKVMEGAQRPGHFNGVAQVVSRLFDIVRPRKAYFGEKDFQQIAVIEAMVEQLGMDIKIVRCPVIREKDGLAMSSRNALLSPEQRKAAPLIYKTLKEAAACIATGEDPAKVIERAKIAIDENPFLETEYIELADERTLQKVTEKTNEKRIFAAIRCGNVRLIDNISIT